MKFIIENIHKSFNDNKVLRGASFEFENGKIYGLLGRNGSGKTTLFNCIYDELSPDSGKFSIEENGVRRNIDINNISYILSTPAVPPFLTCREFLNFIFDINNIDRSEVDRYLDMLYIKEEDRDKLMKDFSHGMKNKIQILSGLPLKPEIILLDEPLTSLDIIAAEQIKTFLQDLKKDRIIILSTHILDIALNVCDEIVILKDGELELIHKENLEQEDFKNRIIQSLRGEDEKDH